MICTLLSVFWFLVSLIAFLLSAHKVEALYADGWYGGDPLLPILLTIAFGIALLASFTYLCDDLWRISRAHMPRVQERRFAKLRVRRAALVAGVKHDVHLVKSVIEFNTEVIEEQLLRLDPWHSWFYNPEILEIKPIDLNKIEVAKGESGHAAIRKVV